VRSSSDVTALLLDAYHLDSAFGNAGKVITTIQNREQATDVAVQPDGKIVVVGSLYSPSLTSDFFLARYLANGTPDKSFGANGLVITNIDQKAEARVLLLQTDGKIIAAGWAWTSDPYHLYCVLARYTAAGQLDPTFGTGGIVRTNIFEYHTQIYALGLQADGKIIAAGSATDRDVPYPASRFLLVRYNANGSLDTTLNTTGIVTTLIRGYDFANAVIVLPSGKLLAVGGSTPRGPTAPAFTLVRYNANGSVDTSFGDNGAAVTILNGVVQAAALQPDGKILAVGGGPLLYGQRGFSLVRYTPTGQLDTSFQGGVITSTIDFSASDVAMRPDGGIVVAGTTISATNPDFLISGYGADGFPEVRTPTDFGAIDAATAIALQSDGKVVLAGNMGDTNNTFPAGRIALARYALSAVPAHDTFLPIAARS
jgi:uncharacterized delta-60 repeat protein